MALVALSAPDLEDVAPYIAQAGYRHAADALARCTRYLRSEERIARATSRLSLGLHRRTRLAHAARVGNAARCTFLIAHGADAGARDAFGRSPLTEALAGGHDCCAALLRAQGARDLPPFSGVLHATWASPAQAWGGADVVWSLAVLGGGCVAVGHTSGAIRVLDMATGAVTATLAGHEDTVRTLAALPCGQRLASGSEDRTVRLWDVRSGTCDAVLEGHAEFVTSLAVLRDGRIASSSVDRTVRLWDVSSRACTAVLAHDQPVRALAALPCGGLAAGCTDGTIALWNVAGVCIATLGGGAGFQLVCSLTVLVDGRLAVGCGYGYHEGRIGVWDLRKSTRDAVLTGHVGPVCALAVLPSGRLVSGSSAKAIKVWEAALFVRGGELTRIADATIDGQAAVYVVAVLPSGGVVSGHVDGTVRVWR